ncbi:hypothetical protein MUO14_15120 [Halobacillus shinanisalinarum]|uniref:Uncharacterized protein n=1 Tax=Halobacillus shinanisalinarum TaxID=2932258 RepID=A0ABY4GV48_9BACI|nr:hypothetical protein [Halobacillus shinanisalinarum]UOQ91846.1 hypothetical protein MUO14_15120 [Halobacillus shinanisalinarum]
MNRETKDIVIQFITLPLLLKVLRQDKKLFDDFKTRNVYLDTLDSVMESVQADLNHVKQQMIQNII